MIVWRLLHQARRRRCLCQAWGDFRRRQSSRLCVIRFLIRLLGRIRKHRLDASCQLILTLGCDERVFASHLEVAVAGDFAGFDCTAANLLPPCDIRPPERVRTQPRKVATLGFRGLV